jgi:hypothetical protein
MNPKIGLRIHTKLMIELKSDNSAGPSFSTSLKKLFIESYENVEKPRQRAMIKITT